MSTILGLLQDDILNAEDRRSERRFLLPRNHDDLERAKAYPTAKEAFCVFCEEYLGTSLTSYLCSVSDEGDRESRGKTKFSSVPRPQFLYLVLLTVSLDVHGSVSSTHIMFLLEPLKMFGDAQTWHKILIMNLGCPN